MHISLSLTKQIRVSKLPRKSEHGGNVISGKVVRRP